jgi:hypothetical protein
MIAPGKRILSLAVVGSLCATAALAIAILLFSEFHRTQGRILGTTALIAFAGAACASSGNPLRAPGSVLIYMGDRRQQRAIRRFATSEHVRGESVGPRYIYGRSPTAEGDQAICDQ